MSDSPDGSRDERSPDFFDQLIETAPRDQQSSSASNAAFTIGFRGYDKGEVDAALASLRAQVQQLSDQLAETQTRETESVEAIRAEEREAREALESELAAANAKAADAEQQVATLTSELVDTPQPDGEEAPSRQQFEAILRVAEEQANVLIQNAAVQADRLMAAAREEVAAQRAEAEADADRITSQAQRDADQVRLKMETEYTAHEARIEREASHAAEKVNQASQEATAIRTEAEKGAAALRSLVTRETTQLRADAEREVREMNARVLEFEETLTRRQDDAQQEFLVLHNQAVAHAERITTDANEQVTASLEHAQRISAKADDYERLMRSQAQAIEADAQVRAREILDRARVKSQKIVDAVTGHTTAVLHDAEDRTRQLRWQQQQLSSFMAEVRELIRPDGIFSDDALPSSIAVAEATIDDEDESGSEATETVVETFLGDEVLDDELDDDSPLEKITIDVVETDDSKR
ncbi:MULTISPECIES: DivIVA domain-containing protein [Microbacterium]|uniref:DivIVA domain-containing protein n=1 Tax=Microbacterium sufflavum TaxID=2851649 RepID=A0ABY4IES6_9MICO|nr:MULTISPECIES: DivIVA domain-containing protein [Microbacterium]MBN6190909.1 DivIVA domain-containing protein [Aneurinibacillus sp. BA2021]MCK2026250.1 DivIVA domain-containing protein [Microbacterium sufflavum]UPL11047.1 DivIVA domain-containing protein [Microbacterium sufflavum]